MAKLKPATYGCETCRQKYNMGKETTVRIYLAQPWFNHIETVCPGCETHWVLVDIVEATIRYLEANNMVEGDEVNWECYNTAPEPVWRNYCIMTGRVFPEDPWLSPRQLHYINTHTAFFRYLLERGDDEGLRAASAD